MNETKRTKIKEAMDWFINPDRSETLSGGAEFNAVGSKKETKTRKMK